MDNETIYKLGFEAAMNWLYQDTADYVKRKKEVSNDNKFDPSFLRDLYLMREAYDKLKSRFAIN